MPAAAAQNFLQYSKEGSPVGPVHPDDRSTLTTGPTARPPLDGDSPLPLLSSEPAVGMLPLDGDSPLLLPLLSSEPTVRPLPVAGDSLLLLPSSPSSVLSLLWLWLAGAG